MLTVSVDSFLDVGPPIGSETGSLQAMVEKQHPMLHPPTRVPAVLQSRWDEQDAGPCLDMDAIWRVSIGLDLANRTVLEAEVLSWRICFAKAYAKPHA